ncbi:hypothetical protein ACPV36_12385 [Photobacterium damselae]|uniref:hypothetical protein n=1 Tax=Photobacterium damselae TaxID=38293 RepID=UPI0040676B33
MRKLTQRTLATLLLATPLFALADTKAANNQVELAPALQTKVIVKVIPDCTVDAPLEVKYGDISKGVTRMPFTISINCKPLASTHLNVVADSIWDVNMDGDAIDFGDNSKFEIFDNGRKVRLDGMGTVCSGLENRRCQLEGRVSIDTLIGNFSTLIRFTHVID